MQDNCFHIVRIIIDFRDICSSEIVFFKPYLLNLTTESFTRKIENFPLIIKTTPQPKYHTLKSKNSKPKEIFYKRIKISDIDRVIIINKINWEIKVSFLNIIIKDYSSRESIDNI